MGGTDPGSYFLARPAGRAAVPGVVVLMAPRSEDALADVRECVTELRRLGAAAGQRRRSFKTACSA